MTSWETLCSSIQQHVKSSSAAESKLLEYYCEGQSHIARLRVVRPVAGAIDRILTVFMKDSICKDYIAIISDDELSSLTPSTKSYMFSSLITGTVLSTADRPRAETEDVLPTFLLSKSQRYCFMKYYLLDTTTESGALHNSRLL